MILTVWGVLEALWYILNKNNPQDLYNISRRMALQGCQRAKIRLKIKILNWN